MRDNYYVFNKFDYVGVLTYDSETKLFSFKVEGTTEAARVACLKLNVDKDQNWFRETLFDRVMPEDRVDCRQVLRNIGMEKYDAWELLKYNNLSTVTDCIWMSKEKNPQLFYTHSMWGPVARIEERNEQK